VRKAFADTMLSVGMEDEKLVVLVGDISHNILQPFAQACPGRYFNVGILEPTIVGMAAGLAISGLRPVVHTIAPFLVERSYEQIKLDFGYQALAGTFISVGGAFDYAQLGCSHHTYADLALMKSIPGSVVMCPSSATEFSTLFRSTYKDKLAYLRLSEKHGYDFPVEVGKAVKMKDGDRSTVVAVGPQLHYAMQIPEVDVIYVHTVKPLDLETIRKSAQKTGSIFVLEEHGRVGSVGDEVARLGFKMNHLHIPDEFLRGYGTRQDQLEKMVISEI
jgi:transketolase